MSSWDAPTGNWDSRPEPEEAGGPGEQDYQQGEPTGGHHAGRGSEGRMRAGRRALPGYEQAQNQDPTAGAFDRGTGYGQEAGYGQPPVYDPVSGYGPSTSQPSGFGPGSQGGYGGGSPGFGGSPQAGYASGPHRAVGQGRSEVDPLTAPGPFSSPQPGYQASPQRPLGSMTRIR